MNKSRRKFLAAGAGAAALAGCERRGAEAPLTSSGANMRAYGERAAQEKASRVLRQLSASPGVGSSRTPLGDLYGTITPSALHFERHHAGVPTIDPAAHSLLVHGLVEKALVFSVEDVK